MMTSIRTPLLNNLKLHYFRELTFVTKEEVCDYCITVNALDLEDFWDIEDYNQLYRIPPGFESKVLYLLEVEPQNEKHSRIFRITPCIYYAPDSAVHTESSLKVIVKIYEQGSK